MRKLDVGNFFPESTVNVCLFYCLFIISCTIMFSKKFGTPRILKFVQFGFWGCLLYLLREMFSIFVKITRNFRWSFFQWLLNLTFLDCRDPSKLNTFSASTCTMITVWNTYCKSPVSNVYPLQLNPLMHNVPKWSDTL